MDSKAVRWWQLRHRNFTKGHECASECHDPKDSVFPLLTRRVWQQLLMVSSEYQLLIPRYTVGQSVTFSNYHVLLLGHFPSANAPRKPSAAAFCKICREGGRERERRDLIWRWSYTLSRSPSDKSLCISQYNSVFKPVSVVILLHWLTGSDEF